MRGVTFENVTLDDLVVADRIKLTYPDGTVLVGQYMQTPGAATEGTTIISLHISGIGPMPVDITGASIERIVVL